MLKRILDYFTEPYNDYDDVWRGTEYYREMDERRLKFEIAIYTIAFIIFVIIYVKANG